MVILVVGTIIVFSLTIMVMITQMKDIVIDFKRVVNALLFYDEQHHKI